MVRCPLFKVPMFLQINATDMGMGASSNVLIRDRPVLCRLFKFHLYREFHLYNRLAGRPREACRATASLQGDREGRPYYTRQGPADPCIVGAGLAPSLSGAPALSGARGR